VGVDERRGSGPEAALVSALERQVAELQAQARALDEERGDMEQRLKAREEEAARLAQQLEDDLEHGKGTDRLVAQTARVANARIIEQLNNQVGGCGAGRHCTPRNRAPCSPAPPGPLRTHMASATGGLPQQPAGGQGGGAAAPAGGGA
jgi:hypothetical protein